MTIENTLTNRELSQFMKETLLHHNQCYNHLTAAIKIHLERWFETSDYVKYKKTYVEDLPVVRKYIIYIKRNHRDDISYPITVVTLITKILRDMQVHKDKKKDNAIRQQIILAIVDEAKDYVLNNMPKILVHDDSNAVENSLDDLTSKRLADAISFLEI